MTTTSYNESGQVYTETICAGGPMTADWLWKTTGSTRKQGRYRSQGPGCSPLSNMTIRSVLKNSYMLTSQSLEGLPWKLGRLLWQRLVQSQLDSVRVWKAFAIAYPNAPEKRLLRKTMIIENPNMPLSSYIEPIDSPSFHWLNFLSLQNIKCPRTALLQIPRLMNLAALTIGEGIYAPDIGVDDSMVRTWGRIAATDSNAFTMLRVLSLRGQSCITSRIFEYLDAFPMLAVLNIDGCGLGHRDECVAESQGWKRRTDVEGDLVNVSDEATAADWESSLHTFFKLAGTYGVEKLTQEGVRTADDLPRLYLALGGEPSYTVVGVAGTSATSWFFRVLSWEARKVADPSKVAVKRPMSGHSSLAKNNDFARKRTVRVSKQLDLADSLLGFGT
ncbi:MAG: hypothetical protein Q9217_003890 [Psora testacea]